MNKALLIVRPQPGADATAARARQAGLLPIVHPLFAVHPLPWTPPSPAAFDAILFTSANSLRHGGSALRAFTHLPAFAVGEATAAAARQAGFGNVAVGQGTIAGLAPTIIARGVKRLFHPGGLHVRPFDHGPMHVHHVPVYVAQEIEGRPVLAEPLGIEPLVAMIHSPRAAARFAALTPLSQRDRISLAVISQAAAQQAGTGWATVAVAATPSDKALLALCISLCK